MSMDLELLKFVLSVINLVAVVWLALSGRNRVTKDALDAKLSGFGDRLTAIERDQRHAPTHDDLKRIHSRLDEALTGLSSVNGKLEGTNKTLDLIHEHLLNRD